MGLGGPSRKRVPKCLKGPKTTYTTFIIAKKQSKRSKKGPSYYILDPPGPSFKHSKGQTCAMAKNQGPRSSKSRIKYTIQDPGLPRSRVKYTFQDPGFPGSHVQYTLQDPRFPRSHVKYTFQDPGFPRSHDKFKFQNPESSRSHNLESPRPKIPQVHISGSGIPKIP